jgi:DNA replication factor Dna2
VDEAAKTAWAKRDQNHNRQQLLTTAAATAATTTTSKIKTTTSPGALFDDDWTEEDMAAMEATGAASLTFTRYRVLAVAVDDDMMMMNAFTKQLTLAIWTTDMLREEEQALRNRHHPSYERTTANEEKRNKEWPAAGVLYLVGSWSQTNVRIGDTIHLCSLLGRTNTKVLPKSVGGNGNDDDLVMIVHPDLLLAPTIISEGVACPRRAVLRSRLGSTGLTSTCH